MSRVCGLPEFPLDLLISNSSMDSSGFNTIVQNYTDLTSREYEQLQKLSAQYPYSQLLHLLLSRAARDLKHKDEEQLLHLSAVYSTDRQVLKTIITSSKEVDVVARKKSAGEKIV